MIEINLLKTRQERFYQKIFLIRIMFVYVLGFVFLLIILGISFLSNRIAIKSALSAIEKYNQRIKEQQNIVESLENYRAEIEKISKALFLGQEEYKKRILWSKRFNIIVSSVPDSIALDKMFLSQKTQGEKNQEVFVIEGTVMPGIENTSGAITRFMNDIKSNSTSEFGSIALVEVRKVDKSASIQGTMFKIECEVK